MTARFDILGTMINYIDLAKTTNIGKELAELPQSIQDEINELYANATLQELNDNLHPDNVYVNGFMSFDNEDMARNSDFSEDEINSLSEDQIREVFASVNCTYLGSAEGAFYGIDNHCV